MRCRPSLLAAIADLPSPPYCGRQHSRHRRAPLQQRRWRPLSHSTSPATALSTGTAPSAATIAKAVTAARDADAVVVATYNLTATGSQKTLAEQLVATGRPVIAVAIRNPYDVAQLPSVPAYLATYSWTDVELRAAARVIAGKVGPRGRLPVAVRRADDPTRVLYSFGFGLSY